MKESVGYTVSLNIMIVFITIVIAFLVSALIYFKSNKTNNIITSAIEKYEGYNTNAKNEIKRNLSSIGYGSHAISCGSVDDKDAYSCSHIAGTGPDGYCVYICYETNDFLGTKYVGDYYYYKIRTNMMVNIPIINSLLDVPIYSNTIRLYNFKK